MTIVCSRAIEEWQLDPELAYRLELIAECFAQRTGRELSIISGYRTPDEQRALKERGRPAAPVDLSNHTICPARAADVKISGFVSRSLKVALGECATTHMLRWGGGSPLDDGIPSDWNHLDLGPRTDAVAEAFRGRNV